MSKKTQQKANKPATTKTPVPPQPVKDKKQVMAEPENRRALLIRLCLALVAVVFVLYINTLQNGYVLDDEIMVKSNTIVAKGLAGVGELLSTPHMRGYLIVPNDDYRPLSLVMFAIERQFFGPGPMSHHFFNIVVFAGCVLMLFLFLHQFLGGAKPIAAFVGALIFAVHPIHTEVVANIKSRDELLCFFFGFLALNIFMNYMRSGKPLQLAFGMFSLFLAFLSKENVITFIGVVPLLFFVYQAADRKRAAVITGSTVLVSIVFIVMSRLILHAYHANESSSIEFIDNALVNAPSFMSRIATAISISGRYLKLLFVPYPLVCNYSYNSIPFASFADPVVLASMLAYAAMIGFAITRLLKVRKDPWAFAILYFLMTISLFTNLFMLIGAEMGERFLFMASAGVCMAVAFAADKWLISPANANSIKGLLSGKVILPLLILAIAFGSMSFSRNYDWKDNPSLYRADVEKSPNDARLAYYMGTSLAEDQYASETDTAKQKEIDREALVHLKRSLSIYSKFAEANAELGRVYDRLQIYDSAEHFDKEAVRINPTHTVALNNLGSVYLATGRYAQAAETYRQAIATNPNFQLAYFNLGRTYNQLKNYDSAIYFYSKMLQLQPGYPDAEQELGMAYFMKQNYDEAEKCFKSVLQTTPNDANAVNNLGAVYLNTKKYPLAIEQFRHSVQINPNYFNAYSNLGRAYYFTQQYSLAVEAFSKELSIDGRNGIKDIPFLALSYKGEGNMEMALKYEAIAKQYYSNFKL